MKKIFFIFVLCSSFSLSYAQSKESFVPHSFHIKLLQQYESAIPGAPKRENPGAIFYQYPGKLKFEITGSNALQLITNGEKTWYYTPPAIEGTPGELNISKGPQSQLSTLFDLLRKGMNSNESYQVENLSQNEVRLNFSSQVAEEIDIKQVQIVFSDPSKRFSNIQKIDIYYLDDHQTTFIFQKISKNPTLLNNFFKFEPPPNTRINRL